MILKPAHGNQNNREIDRIRDGINMQKGNGSSTFDGEEKIVTRYVETHLIKIQEKRTAFVLEMLA